MSLCDICKHSIDNQPGVMHDYTECDQCIVNVNCVYLRFELDTKALKKVVE